MWEVGTPVVRANKGLCRESSQRRLQVYFGAGGFPEKSWRECFTLIYEELDSFFFMVLSPWLRSMRSFACFRVLQRLGGPTTKKKI